MTHCRDRLFKATYPTSPRKERPYEPALESVPEIAEITRIDSKQDAANAVKMLLNSPRNNKK
jgi:hypothetical protein